MDQNSQNDVWINNVRTARPTFILMLFLSSLDNFTIREVYYFSKDIDNFQKEHKTC